MWAAGLLIVAGLGFIVAGAFIVNTALGLGVAGGSLTLLGVLLARTKQ